MEIENRTGNQVSRITSGSQEFSIRSTLQPDLQMIIAYQMRELTAPAFLLKPVSVKWEADCKTSRDLRSTHLTSQALLENLKLFDVTGDTTFDPDKSNLTFKGDVRLDGDPRLAGLVKAAAILKQTGDVRVASHLDAQVDAAQSVQFKSQSSTSEFKLPGLKKPWTATLSSQSNWNQPQRHLDFTGQFGVNNSDYGQWQIQSKLEMTSTTGQAATSSSLLTTSGRTEIKEIRSAVSQIFPVHFSEPMIVTHKISVVNGKPSGDVEAVLPSIEIAKLGKALNTKVSLLVRSPDLAAAKNIDFAMEFQQGQILLEQKLAGQVAALNGLKMTMKAQVRDGSKLTLEEFHADINQSAINMTADATGNTLSKDFQAHAQLNLQIPGDFPEVAGQTIRGQIQVPVSLSIVRGDDVNLSGSVNMRNFSWSKGDLSATGISGRVPFSEKLRREGKVIKFSQLITQNPFERVDFERVRPLIQGADQMTIEKIKWQEKTYGPFVGFFDVHQNMLFAHQFDMDLGAGRVYGEMFFDAYPANLQFGLLSRLTSLNLSEILPKQYLKRMPSGDKNISGRSGFVLDLNKTTMDGRIDITEIGGPQLTALINILDPKYEDEKLNKLRSLLGVGYPTSVALAFAEGYMDMDVGITALGISQRQSLRGIPISTLITQSTSDLVKETQKGPLK